MRQLHLQDDCVSRDPQGALPTELRAEPNGQHREWKIPIVDSARLIFAETGGKAFDAPPPL
jgi:hypothetical protein